LIKTIILSPADHEVLVLHSECPVLCRHSEASIFQLVTPTLFYRFLETKYDNVHVFYSILSKDHSLSTFYNDIDSSMEIYYTCHICTTKICIFILLLHD
jgi:hypothetical protein